MKTSRFVSCVFAGLVLSPLLWAENEIGFVEKFALAPDREAVLSQLLPGSEDFYFYSALHFQNTKQAAKLTAILDQWSKRYPNSEWRKVIENRAALLAYDADPQTTLKFLKDRLHLEFNHQQKARDQKPDLPTQLDQALIGRAVFQREALENGENLGDFRDQALPTLLRDKVALKAPQRRDLLQRLKRPDVPGLVDVVMADLQTKESRGFGEFEIHAALLPEQLDELARRLPSLFENQKFVAARLAKLAPSADADGEFDPVERAALLDRQWAYAKNLSASFNTLKAHILYRRLQFDRTRGVYDKARFIEYLKLPRRAVYAIEEVLRRSDVAAQLVDLNLQLSDYPGLLGDPIRNDEPLVRDYLLRLLADESSWEPWAVWLRDTWLKPVFAEAKITRGSGDAERWASLISPAAFQALKERVDVDFSPANPPFLAPNDDVSLDLFLKNTSSLIVKIYEVNTLSYFLGSQRQLNTDLPLDGLIANREVTHDFTTDEAGRNPFRRTMRTFKFPELKGQRGAWIIEFIGGGKSSRALVRKGQWSLLQRTGPAGDLLTVVDETRKPVKDAVVWLEGRKYTLDEKTGYIPVPFTNQPGIKSIVLADPSGEFASLTSFEHHAEAYRLDAQIFVEREQLLARREATIAVRAALLLNDAQVPLDLLDELRLTITSTTLDGVATTNDVKIDKLDSTRVFTHQIVVPERLATLEVALSGQVEQLSKGGARQVLSATHQVSINGLDRTTRTNTGLLSKFGGDFVFELLGKNGEPVPDRAVGFAFHHQDFSEDIQVDLRTDAAGRIVLGKLGEIEGLEAAVKEEGKSEEDRMSWDLEESGHTWPAAIHARVGETIQLPWAQTPAAGAVSLLEVRGGRFVADRTAAAVLLADGVLPKNGGPAKVSALAIHDLAPGDYSLQAGGQQPVAIRVTAGEAVQNWLVSPNRELEVRAGSPVFIRDVQRENGALVVQLGNAGKFARVHVAATRFLPETTLFSGLSGFTRFEPGLGSPARLPNLFAAGRAIGDEYRYILARRYTRTFPGNMLTRPALLLNPWEVRSTSLQAQNMEAMQRAGSTAGGRGAAKKAAEAQSSEAKSVMEAVTEEGANLDFLAAASPVLFNLMPDEKGVVRIDLKALGERPYVQVYVEDLASADWRTLALEEVPAKFQDLRLARNLDPQKPFAEKKETTVLTTGQTLTLADILTAELETYDSLTGVHALFTTLSHDPKLAKFAWILQWPTFKDEEKRAKYSEFACHELSFFLSRKDPVFFQKVVLPYLQNKKDRTFLDDYLLGRELRGYLEPWQLARLNAAERALLAQRLPGEAARMARAQRELWELLTPNPERENQLFETALRGRSLQEGGEGSFKSEKEAALDSPALNMAAAAPAPVLAPASPPPPKNGSTHSSLSRSLKSADASGLSADGQPVEAEKRKQLADRGDFDTGAANGNGTLALGATNTYAGTNPVTAGNRSGNLAVSQNAIDALLFGVMGGEDTKRQREVVRSFFRALGPTKEWAENNYDRLPIQQQDDSLIPINAFWRDYAAWDGKTPFMSAQVTEASRNFSEMMLALAVLDLPFTSPKHATKTDGGQFTLNAAGPLIAFHKEIKPAALAPGQNELLITENFFRADDRFREEGNERFNKYVTEEFLTGVVYGANVVVTNPTSAPQKLTALLQIPHGALPVNGSKATDSRRLKLEPYTTQTLEYFFYFPALKQEKAVSEPHYPVHVARDEQIVGVAKPFAFQVVPQLTQVDKTSWNYLSQYGTDAEVFTFLEQTNIARLDLEQIAWRARKSADFFRKLVALLETRHVYSEPIYRYAALHNVAAPLATWLRNRDDFVEKCGPYLETKLLKIDPVERRTYEHLEYSPLVNQRIHRIGAENRIPNPVLRSQYQRLLFILAHKPALDAADQMSVTYFLFLQDRVEEALALFHTIKPEALPTRLQHDYFRCYAAFYEEQPAVARGIVQQYADYPVDRWRQLFAEVATQLDEIEGKPVTRPNDKQPNREKQQAELAQTEPSFDFKVESRQIALTWRNLGAVTINYYLMNPEFMFSASPFVAQETGRFSIIKPTRTAAQALPAGQDTLAIPLPGEFAKSNVLVEILGAGQRKAQTYHANTLKLTFAEAYGRLEARDEAAGKPISKAYVKVYARLRNGTVRYFKDGYTDLRGKFDYASLNSSEGRAVPATPSNPGTAAAGLSYQMLSPGELDEVEKLSVLVMSEAHGTTVREVDPPRQ